MEIRELPASEPAVRRYVADLWLPYNRELEATVEAHALPDDVALVAAETEFRLDRLGGDDHRLWLALDGDFTGESDTLSIAAFDAEFAGFVAASVDECPPAFDRPDRVVVDDLYVRDSHRGTGLARDLVDRAAAWARDRECAALALDVDVDVDNERTRAFYEKLGFEPVRHRLTALVEEI